MKRFFIILIVAFFLFGLLACSSTKTGKGKSNPVKYKKKLERVTRVDFLNKTRLILQNKYQYIFIRAEDNEGQQYIETDWKYRNPFDDEIDSGITEARSKVFLTAYPRSVSNNQGLWIPTIEIVNEVKMGANSEWVELPISKEAQRYYDQITDDLNLEFRMGVRKF